MARKLSDTKASPVAPTTKLILRGAMRGKRVSTFRKIGVGPIRASGGTWGSRMAGEQRQLDALGQHSWGDRSRRLAALRAAFYRLPG